MNLELAEVIFNGLCGLAELVFETDSSTPAQKPTPPPLPEQTTPSE